MFSSSEFINKSISIFIYNDSSDSSESFSCKPFNFGIFFTWFNKSGRMNLNSFHINNITSNSLRHFNSISFAMITIGGWEWE